MAKVFFENKTPAGERLGARIPLHEWIKNILKEYPGLAMYELLVEGGKYFTESLACPPKGVMLPTVVENLQCHANNMLYIDTLSKKQPEVLGDFNFVCGFYGLKAKEGYCVPPDLQYHIGHHSFMTYKGSIVDFTLLKYPPTRYEIDQYFGVAFEIDTVLARQRLVTEKEQTVGMLNPFEVFANELL